MSKSIFLSTEHQIAILFSITTISLMFPYGFPIFGPVTLAFVVVNIILKRFKITINFSYLLFLILILIYFISILYSNGMNYSVVKNDVINIFTYLLLWILLSGLSNYKKMIYIFSTIISFFGSIIAIISIYKYYLLINGVEIKYFTVNGLYPLGSSLVVDYNMFTFGMLTVLVLTIYKFSLTENVTQKLIYIVMIIPIVLSIFFAGSRRGWIILALVILTVATIFIIKFILENNNIPRFIFNSLLYISLFTLIILVANYFEIFKIFLNNDIWDNLLFRLNTLNIGETTSFDTRTVRWELAFDLYSNFNFLQMIVGDGFEYLQVFGNEFSLDKKEDYPHNPLLSTLLYSGILGTSIFITFIVTTIIKILIASKDINVYFILVFLISIFYTIISFNSFFSSTLFFMYILFFCSYNINLTRNKGVMI